MSVKINVTLKEVRNSLAALIEIGKKEGLDFKFNYRIAKICKTIEPIIKLYEESLNKFFKENGKYDDKTGAMGLDPKDQAKFLKFNETNLELLDEVHEIEIETIPIKMFEDYDIQSELIRPILWIINGDI